MDAARPRPPDILARIVAHERSSLAERRTRCPVEVLRRRVGWDLPRRSLRAALAAHLPAVIAECKRRSPSRGVLRESYDPVAIARSYERAGAAAISVLTNDEFFGGSLDDLAAVRDGVSVPVLRKDFIVDGYQLAEARAAGADAVLLIAAVLDPGELRALVGRARELGLETLIEAHDARELAAAVAAGGDVLGVNNRDLKSFTTDLATTERLAPLAPPDAVLVAESGIRHAGDLARLGRAGIRAFLVGEAFMAAPDPGEALRALLAEQREARA
jgi:indole-3-glycerol phosphate synthase